MMQGTSCVDVTTEGVERGKLHSNCAQFGSILRHQDYFLLLDRMNVVILSLTNVLTPTPSPSFLVSSTKPSMLTERE